MRKYRAVIMAVFWVFILVFLGCNFTFAYCPTEDGVPERSGPIGIRNQMPLYLLYLQMIPEKTEVTKRNKLTINADYTVSNITVDTFTPGTSLYDIDIDLEVSRITLDCRYGLYDNLEIGLEVPYISLSSGYLDGAIESIEEGIGAITPRSRTRQGSYNFNYSLRYNNTYLIQQVNHTEGLGDIVLSAKYQLLQEEEWWFRPNLSVRSAIKFPTADKDDLLGSGELDYGFGVVLDKGFFHRLFVYAGLNIIMIEKPSVLSELAIDNHFLSGMLAMEYFFTQRFSLVTQVSGNSTPYSKSGTTVLDNDAYELGAGFNYRWKGNSNVSCHFALIENIKSASSPDVTFHTGLSWRF